MVPYPEYYDGRSYDPSAPLTAEEMNGGTDVVRKLLLEWTPAGDELREQEMEKGGEMRESNSESNSDIPVWSSAQEKNVVDGGRNRVRRRSEYKGKEREDVGRRKFAS